MNGSLHRKLKILVEGEAEGAVEEEAGGKVQREEREYNVGFLTDNQVVPVSHQY